VAAGEAGSWAVSGVSGSAILQTRAERRGCRARLKAKQWGAGSVVSYSGCVSLHRIKHEISLSCKCMHSRSTGLLACTHLCAYDFRCYIEKAMDV
jgi:hypothetical protein